MTNPTTTPGGGQAGQPPLPADTAGALQQALGAENAAIWVYGLASAFVGGGVAPAVIAAETTHQARRDAVRRLLTDGGQTPEPAQPAYALPQPVTDQPSALAVLTIAETDCTVAWRAVLERTDDAGLRQTGLAALTDSALRETRWRRLSGVSPASIPMPGQPTP
jgi:hypothetical protein